MCLQYKILWYFFIKKIKRFCPFLLSFSPNFIFKFWESKYVSNIVNKTVIGSTTPLEKKFNLIKYSFFLNQRVINNSIYHKQENLIKKNSKWWKIICWKENLFVTNRRLFIYSYIIILINLYEIKEIFVLFLNCFIKISLIKSLLKI